MATTPQGAITGLWKGLAVTKDNRFVVLVFFDQDSDELKGRFEMPELSGQSSEGDLTISLKENQIGFTGSPGMQFAGEIVGEDQRIIFGHLRSDKGKPVGTLTLFQTTIEPPDNIPTTLYSTL